jgi:hypothetical protein
MAVLVHGLKHFVNISEIEPFVSLVDRDGPPLALSLLGLSDAEVEAQVRVRRDALPSGVIVSHGKIRGRRCRRCLPQGPRERESQMCRFFPPYPRGIV